MRGRCLNPSNAAYKHYGMRGITVCQEWADDFDRFVKDMGLCPDGLTLERRNNELGYSRENCKWASMTDQQNNKRTNVTIELKGTKRTLGQWATVLGTRYDTLRLRIKRGMPIEKALVSKKLNTGWDHGTRTGYEYGCRCGPCRLFHNARMCAVRAKKNLQAAT